MHHPKDLIARAKGLMFFCQIESKVIAAATNVPLHTVMAWRSGKRCSSIAPDRVVREELNVLIRGGHVPHGTEVPSSVAAGEVRLQETQQAPAAPDSAPGNGA